MRKIYIGIFLAVILVSLIGNAAKIENDYISHSVRRQVTDIQFSDDSLDSTSLGKQQFLTISLLLGAGLVGLLVIRRK